jgi:hypothetical protein
MRIDVRSGRGVTFARRASLAPHARGSATDCLRFANHHQQQTTRIVGLRCRRLCCLFVRLSTPFGEQQCATTCIDSDHKTNRILISNLKQQHRRHVDDEIRTGGACARRGVADRCGRATTSTTTVDDDDTRAGWDTMSLRQKGLFGLLLDCDIGDNGYAKRLALVFVPCNSAVRQSSTTA